MNKIKRRNNILYKLRKKHFRCSTRERIIFCPSAEEPDSVPQIRRLRKEFNFTVQYEL